uniref:Zgc:171844 n=1 Tax=Fundulus heteroclitus TaxID=8078 RepID=A0A3Q2QJ09_FUNHE
FTNMEEERKSSQQYGALDQTELHRGTEKSKDVISMADSTVTIEDIEGELFRIERIREVLVRRESELRYMMDDIQLCKEITKLKQELQRLVTIPDKSTEDREKEEELLKQINKLVETRDFLVDDVEFERLSEMSEAYRLRTCPCFKLLHIFVPAVFLDLHDAVCICMFPFVTSESNLLHCCLFRDIEVMGAELKCPHLRFFS